MNNDKPGLYLKGDRVWIDKLYVLGDITMEVVKLDNPIIAYIKEVKERCSEPFGIPYVVDLPKNITDNYNCAKVCYWESDIMFKADEEEELFWKVWGDQ